MGTHVRDRQQYKLINTSECWCTLLPCAPNQPIIKCPYFCPRELETPDYTLLCDITPWRHNMTLWRQGVISWHHSKTSDDILSHDRVKGHRGQWIWISENHIFSDDLDLWPIILTFKLILSRSPLVHRSSGLAGRALTDRHTDWTDFIPSAADMGGNIQCLSPFASKY